MWGVGDSVGKMEWGSMEGGVWGSVGVVCGRDEGVSEVTWARGAEYISGVLEWLDGGVVE